MAQFTPELYFIDARDADHETWNVVRGIAHTAFKNALPIRSQQEIDIATHWLDDTYYAHMANPNKLVGNGLNADQQFWNPHLALALIDKNPAGYMYIADNSSGSNKLIRTLKHHKKDNNYVWVRSMAVSPEYQHKGLASYLARFALSHVNQKRPVTAYIWPNEIEGIQQMLEVHGFTAAGSSSTKPFGDKSDTITEVRMQASSVQAVLTTIKSPRL